ncbi:MAG TPA: Hpt domain-containing protein, partial [Thermodesulfovibrionia bacterium]|nr:Hpt domain-containing protein [Thermodesulfovibrionia bacterium]
KLPSVFNTTCLLKNIGDDFIFFKELLSSFAEQLPCYFEELESAFKAKDHNALKEAAHKVKGAALSIGGETIADCVIKIEKLANSGNTDGVETLITSFKKESEKFMKEVQNFINNIQ